MVFTCFVIRGTFYTRTRVLKTHPRKYTPPPFLPPPSLHFLFFFFGSGDLMITGVMERDGSEGHGDLIELFCINDISDLSIFCPSGMLG